VNEKECTTNASAILTVAPRLRRPATTEELLAAVAVLESIAPTPTKESDYELIDVDQHPQLESFLDSVTRYRNCDWLDYKIRVHRVVPCVDCQRPIVRVKFSHDEEIRDCDAVQRRDGRWFADLLRAHECSQHEGQEELGQ
jgi:hypothetical protein